MTNKTQRLINTADPGGLILVVDDKTDNVDLLNTMLTARGYSVIGSTSGRFALTMAGSRHPDLILLDIRMPGMDGYEVCRHLKADRQLKDIPVIFISALSETDEKVEAFQTGGVDYITKPFHEQEVLMRIRTHLELHRMRIDLEGIAAERTLELQKAHEKNLLDTKRLDALVRLSGMEEATEEEVAQYALEQGIILTGSEGGYFHIYDEDDQSLTFTSWSKEIMQEGTAPAGIHHPLERAEIWAECVLFKKPVIHNDCRDIIDRKNDREDRFRVRSHMSVPVVADKKMAAVSGVCNKKEPYDASDVQQLTLLMTGAWRIINKRRTEQNLVKSEMKFRGLFNDAPDMIHFIDPHGKIIDVNSIGIRSLGYPKEEYINKPLVDIIHKDFREKTARAFNKAMEGEILANYETVLVTKKGGSIDVEVNATPEIENGRVVALRAMVRDITMRKRKAEERKKIEDQLRQAQKMEAIGTLAGGIAHDFNNILSAIFGYSEMTLEGLPKDSKLFSNIQAVIKAGNRAGDLVKHILAFYQHDDRKLQPLKVQLIIKEALKLQCSSIPGTIEIKQNIDPDCKPVLADPTQIHQIIMNLCTNACHAMRETGGILGVSLEPFELTAEESGHRLNLQPGHYLELEISDTGCGISRTNLEQIFEPYFTTKAKGEGTGLGLDIVRGLVRKFLGDIYVFSEQGKGTTFKIYLPVIEQTGNIRQEEDIALLPTGNEGILLVDDDEILVLMYKKMLERLGYKVTDFTSSVVSLDTFRKRPDDFDLLITDMTMPKLTGAELAGQILAIRPEMPIILCTGYSELIDAEKAEAIGVDYYITKPVTRRKLAGIIRKALDG